MNKEDAKAEKERQAFRKFIIRARLSIDPQSVQSRKPPAPDILCEHHAEGALAFELAELCDPQLAASFNRRNRSECEVFWTSDPSVQIVRKKLNKAYETKVPLELLIYVDGRIVTSDNVIIPTLQYEIDFNSQRTFRRVWFMGWQTVKVLHPETIRSS